MFYGNPFVTENLKSHFRSQKFTRYYCSASTIEVYMKKIWISHSSWEGLLGQEPEECGVFSKSRFAKIGRLKPFQVHISASACDALLAIFDELAPHDLYNIIWIKISSNGNIWKVKISIINFLKSQGREKKILLSFNAAFNSGIW